MGNGAIGLGTTIWVITGASGVGKTAAVSALEARGVPGTACFSFDSIGVPTTEVIEQEFGGGEHWQAHATEQWLRRLATESDASTVNVLDAQTRPSFVLAASLGSTPARIRIALLDCEKTVRNARLIARGQAELANAQMDCWAAYLRGQADALSLPILDTTRLSVSEVAGELARLISSP